MTKYLGYIESLLYVFLHVAKGSALSLCRTKRQIMKYNSFRDLLEVQSVKVDWDAEFQEALISVRDNYSDSDKQFFISLFDMCMCKLSREMADEIGCHLQEEYGRDLYKLIKNGSPAKKIRGFLYKAHAQATGIRTLVHESRMKDRSGVYFNKDGRSYCTSFSYYIEEKFKSFKYREEGVKYANFLVRVVEDISIEKSARFEYSTFTLVESERLRPKFIKQDLKYVHIFNKINPHKLEDEILKFMAIKDEVCVSTINANHFCLHCDKYGVVLEGKLEAFFYEDCHSFIRKDGKRIATSWGNDDRPEGWAIPSDMILGGVVCVRESIATVKPIAMKYRIPLYIVEMDNYIYEVIEDHLFDEDDFMPRKKSGLR